MCESCGGSVCIAGITQPEIAIILQKGNSPDDSKFTIVVPPENYIDRLWNGNRINESIARDYFCADEALTSDKLPQVRACVYKRKISGSSSR